MRTRRPAPLLALVTTVALALTGCGTFDRSGSAAEGDQRLVISLQFTPKANYALETDDAFLLTQVGCLETLTRYNAETGNVEPLLATEWKQTEPTAWDFTLRKGVTFQDGSRLTAEKVVNALQRLLDAEVPPRAFTADVISGVTAPDASTVRVTTPEPSALVPLRVASVNTGILAPDAYTGAKIDPIKHCTGPFTPVSEKASQSMTLERNEDYWGGKVALAGVEARFIPEGATRATQVQTGESQIALGIPSANVPELEKNGDLEVSQAFTPRTTGLYFNVSRAPFNDPKVRQAVQLAVDLDAIASSVYDGTAQPATGPFAPGEPWTPKDAKPISQNLAKARALLRSAGYGADELKLTLLGYVERPEFADLGAVIQANLAKIGIKVSVKISEWAGIEQKVLDGDYDFTLLSRNHLTDIADPAGFLEADYSCKGAFNVSQFCDRRIDAQVRAANAEADKAKRYATYAEIAARLQEQAITVFLVHEQTIAARRTNVENFVDDPLARYAVTTDLAFTKS